MEYGKNPIYKTEDVTLTVKIVINKATPVITERPTAKDIDYKQTLGDSRLSGGGARHPTVGTTVEGSFAWTDGGIEPTVAEAAQSSATNGTMKYWLTDDPKAKPDENTEFSSTIPSRANVGTYYIWYKVIGDENYKDTESER